MVVKDLIMREDFRGVRLCEARRVMTIRLIPKSFNNLTLGGSSFGFFQRMLILGEKVSFPPRLMVKS